MSFSITKATCYITTLHLSKRLMFALALFLLMSCSTQVAQERTSGGNDSKDLAEEKAASAELDRLRGIEERRAQDVALEAERIALAEQREAAERERIASEELRQAAENEARLRVQAEREQQREEERERSYSLAVAEQEQKIELISRLEAEVTLVQSALARDQASIDSLREAILAAQDLLAVLITEQAKYENIDAFGETLEPLAKILISELEARLENLTQ